MENQHKKIKGYRELSQYEIDLMNKIKEKAEEVGALMAEFDETVSNPSETASSSYAMRWASLANDHLQQGFMCAVRAIAQPTTY